MIAILSLSALLLCSSAAAAQEAHVDTSKLSSELIVGHPGLFSGDLESMRDDLLEAMLNDRSSPLLGVAAHQVWLLGNYCSRGPSPSILATLIEGIDDGAASFDLRRLYLEELRRSRFLDYSPQKLTARPWHKSDLFNDWFTHWRVLQPWGELDHSTPLRAHTIPPDPRQLQVTDSVNGQTRTWQALQRGHNQTLISPDRFASKTVGSGYAAIWVRAEPQVALLELRANEAMRAWWNGMPTFESLREGLTERSDLHQAYVNVQAGWNLLLVQYRVGDDLRIGGRLLTREGRLLPFYEWQDDSSAPELPAIPMPAEILDLSYWVPTGNDPWDVILRCVLALHHDRADVVLAMPEPIAMSAKQMTAWLHWQHRALAEAYHLPTSIVRNRLIAVEERSQELGSTDLSMSIFAISRMLNEDKREEALTAARALIAAHPHVYGVRKLEANILLEIDRSGTLAQPTLQALASSFPQADWAFEQLQNYADDHGDRSTALNLARTRLNTNTEGGWELINRLLESSDAEQVELASELFARAELEDPDEPSVKRLRHKLWRINGQQSSILQELQQDVADAPNDSGVRRSLAQYQLRQGDLDGAIRSFERVLEIDPSSESTLRALRILGHQDDAEDFFATFAPDVQTQLSKRSDLATGNSTAMLLDSGMVYILPNGGMIYRVHNLDLALDRSGTEILHEMGVFGTPQLARVLASDGSILEPHQVNGSWVMPSLDPGDVIETITDRYMPGLFGVAAHPGEWRFTSFEKPFALSRWVIFVPNDAPGVLREHNFDGSHEIVDWKDGKVHIFSREDNVRLEPELLMPSELELVPWVSFGSDIPLERKAEWWRDYFLWQTSLPADIELELHAFLAELKLKGSNLEKAESIYDAITELILDFEGEGDLVDVWTLKRGNPTFLLSTLYRLAGIPHEWAILQRSAPELNPEPLTPFSNGDSFVYPALRIADNGTEPVWMSLPTRGTPFGDLTPGMLGAGAMVLEVEGYRIENISRDALSDLWDMDLHIAYSIESDDSASVSGKLVMGGVQGASLREGISQLSPQEVDQALRQISAQMVKGLDLRTAQVTDMDVTGGPLIIDFDGVIPDFVQHRGDSSGARLRLPELGLADGLGPAERQYSFALRIAQRARITVELDTGEGWTLEYGPENSSETREGFRYDFSVEKDEQHLRIRRTLEMRGVVIAAADFPDFLANMKVLENQETRAVRLIAASSATKEALDSAAAKEVQEQQAQQ